ncbi:putative ABC transporter ATP-binding protein [Rosistilla oblonga]|uniref:ABC transporter ATP-binding protein n=1 Tax=Rosistilla oblonga TaxID=2527990 RepID=UPI001188BF83|nr:ABC transporter ATP-binding protein [Rosistilla oblonga]QDV12436.1 putative ABC transporter ATP-binding protein [Rosistilla oblonga]
MLQSKIASQTTPLDVQQVVKKYPQGGTVVHALDGVSLSVEPGEFVAIMGASGSGKSTLLHAMAGLIDVDAGRVLVAGQDLSQLADGPLTRFRRDNLGIVFQAYNLIPSLSAEDNIRLPAPKSMGKQLDATVDELFDRLGMTARRHHKPGALSGGEQQRIAIARALICNPTILLADEPTGSLDSVTGTQICELLRDLVDNQGRSIVMVTHEPHVAMWADRICVLKDGTNLAELQTDGSRDPQTVARQYQEALGAETVA